MRYFDIGCYVSMVRELHTLRRSNITLTTPRENGAEPDAFVHVNQSL